MHKNGLELAVLKTVKNNYELNLIKDLLDQHKIPYIIKDRESGGYMKIYSGFSIYGTDILVEKSLLKKAKDILDEFTSK
ncbi:MAG: DUF2007 domain-containing protein [Clostridiaceae bacterium]|nr:DUF2007 domain-containing protein [Clostridiaceae bacterium]MBW4858517.1 DUF2007 domain-containing protein [Clostridiaceae bacterium]MBW4867765.1 DUF2007 domain-containing protein [Clostridiaceae bacterium]MBW4868045.1 DUF2007 domain-containing protein [Clostridiaceae bacterium]